MNRMADIADGGLPIWLREEMRDGGETSRDAGIRRAKRSRRRELDGRDRLLPIRSIGPEKD